MSIRLLAVELYRVIKQVEQLEKHMQDPSLTQAQRDRTAGELRKARLERDRIKAMLEGAKAK
ncbi:hypothetical protein [Desulfoferrobacter suflitae]|uniref:hypothetical protein n=1 Tax=Desulfoferrobacter suflitae TaxID=2865782 RepID=UPI002164CBCA|nr:hypothetical protein [Desulfoferrobacter suflitae]MCK8602257.1 hypothetical protein [Desulfoferrobacter suflitae]